jgi:acetolactate decarboxylase
MKYMIIPFILFSCVPKSKQEVRVAGNLREMMMDNEISAKIDLKRLKRLPHLYALGAVENLGGEISIVDSKVMITRVKSDTIVSESTYDVKATLLVYSQVERFRSVELDQSNDVKSLEVFLRNVAHERKLVQPFAFMVKGTAVDVKFHVISGSSEDHTNHSASGFKSGYKDEVIELLGFYSEQHQGVFTHHGSNMHIHLINRKTGMTAHVDEFEMKANSKLFIPKQP